MTTRKNEPSDRELLISIIAQLEVVTSLVQSLQGDLNERIGNLEKNKPDRSELESVKRLIRRA